MMALSRSLLIFLLGSQLLFCYGHVHVNKNQDGQNLNHFLHNHLKNMNNTLTQMNVNEGHNPVVLNSDPVSTFVTSSTNSNARLTEWSNVCKPMPADTVLNFVGMGLTKIGDAFVESPQTDKLYLDDNNISEVSSNAFTSLERLQLVSLSKNRIPIDKLLWFRSHPTLEILILNDNRAKLNDDKESSLEKILEGLPRLRKLYLKRNGISSFEIDLSNFAPSLSHLDLSGNKLDDLDFLDNLPDRLTHLHLDDNRITLLKSNSLKNIEVMSISGNRIKQLCFSNCDKSFLSLQGMERLTWLNLSRNNIDEVSQDAFLKTSYLRVLDLSNNRIKALPSDVPKLLTSLETLQLSYNMLGTVPNICSLSRLRRLDLSYNNIASVTGADLCAPVGRIHLKVLLMSGNRLTEVDNHAFVHLWQLEELDLSNNLIVNLPVGLISKTRSLKSLSLRNNTINNIDQLFSTSSNVLEEIHLQENPFCAVRYSNDARLVIHFKDLPQDGLDYEEQDGNDSEENDILEEND